MTDSTVLPTIERTATIPRQHRWLSVDVLRGLTIGFMIMVNNNGGGDKAYWAMKHTDWNGFTPTDLVFPTFLFLVGISTVFSTQARLAKGDSKSCTPLPHRPPSHHPFPARPRRQQLPLLPSPHHALLRSPPAHRHLLPHRCHPLSLQPVLEEQSSHRHRLPHRLLDPHAIRPRPRLRRPHPPDPAPR